MKKTTSLFKIKLNELQFQLENLHIHNKINKEAMETFSESFKEHVNNIKDPDQKEKLEILAGLKAPKKKDELSKAAKNAKQQGQYKSGKTKLQHDDPEYRDKINEDAEREVQKVKKPLPKNLKDLYRKIARNSHPDVLEGDELKEEKIDLFRQAQASIEDERYGNLIDCALLLNIDIPEEFSKDYYRPEKIDTRIREIKQQVIQITKSVAWGWYHLESESDKQNLILKYAHFLLQSSK
tara:strand:+ start:1692 stop:2405 length:714 start_codon:yes stop_codon:yes gene_type:complete